MLFERIVVVNPIKIFASIICTSFTHVVPTRARSITLHAFEIGGVNKPQIQTVAPVHVVDENCFGFYVSFKHMQFFSLGIPIIILYDGFNLSQSFTTSVEVNFVSLVPFLFHIRFFCFFHG